VYLALIPHARVASSQVTQGGPGAVEVAVQDGVVGHRDEARGYRQGFPRRVQTSLQSAVTARRSPSLPSAEASVVGRVPATSGPNSIPDGVTGSTTRQHCGSIRENTASGFPVPGSRRKATLARTAGREYPRVRSA
jgi:hypothetical protein